MFLGDMRRERALQFRAIRAQDTREGEVLSVPEHDVPGEVPLQSGAEIAVATRERLLSGVRSHVAVQILGLGEYLLATLTTMVFKCFHLLCGVQDTSKVLMILKQTSEKITISQNETLFINYFLLTISIEIGLQDFSEKKLYRSFMQL